MSNFYDNMDVLKNTATKLTSSKEDKKDISGFEQDIPCKMRIINTYD